MPSLSRLMIVILALTSALGAAEMPWPQAVAMQIALDRAGFSPGLIDGKPGAKTALALREWQIANSLAPTGKMDVDTAAALAVNPDAAFTTYLISDDDMARVIGPVTDWNQRAAMGYLGYESLADLVAEKCHCTIGLLERLNPNLAMSGLSNGVTLNVPAIAPGPIYPADSLDVNLDQKAIRALTSDGRVVALFHCSIAADVTKRPSGSTTIVTIAPNPNYTFDPQLWPDVHNVTHRLMIPPGPRNPVGLCWIALNLPGYGIHGTPKPDMIGKTGSHGCIRLANWDAVRLGKMIRPGATVTFTRAATLAQGQ